MRSGNIKRLQKYIRKHGAKQIISEDYLNVLSNSMYGDFDLMGEWLQAVLHEGLWEKINLKYQVAIQGAPFRIIDSERITPKHLIRTMLSIVTHFNEKHIQGWLPWIIFAHEKTKEDVFAHMDDNMFAYLFYESMDFAHRAAGVKQSFREQMFESDRILLTARARYRAYCLQAMDKHLWRCALIQTISDIGEVPPFMLVHRLGFHRLGEALVTMMSEDYLDSVRDAYLGQLYEGMTDIPVYIYQSQKANHECPPSRDTTTYMFSEDDVHSLFACPELVRQVSKTQPNIFSVVTLFQMREKGLVLDDDFIQQLINKGKDKIVEYWDSDSVYATENAYHYGSWIGDDVRLDIFQSVLYEHGFHTKIMNATTHPFYILDSMVSDALDYMFALETFEPFCSRILSWDTGSEKRQMLLDRRIFKQIQCGKLSQHNFGSLSR